MIDLQPFNLQPNTFLPAYNISGITLALFYGIRHNQKFYIHMKKLFLSALMLTGVVAMAQEPAKETEQSTTTTTTATEQKAPAKEAKPAAQPATQAQPAAPAKKTEATVKEEKTEVRKADPAKKSK
jgi:outer membrane biosynthesis protein TonB